MASLKVKHDKLYKMDDKRKSEVEKKQVKNKSGREKAVAEFQQSLE